MLSKEEKEENNGRSIFSCDRVRSNNWLACLHEDPKRERVHKKTTDPLNRDATAIFERLYVRRSKREIFPIHFLLPSLAQKKSLSSPFSPAQDVKAKNADRDSGGVGARMRIYLFLKGCQS